MEADFRTLQIMSFKYDSSFEHLHVFVKRSYRSASRILGTRMQKTVYVVENPLTQRQVRVSRGAPSTTGPMSGTQKFRPALKRSFLLRDVVSINLQRIVTYAIADTCKPSIGLESVPIRYIFHCEKFCVSRNIEAT